MALSQLVLPILKTSGDSSNVELYNALKQIERMLQEIANARVLPTHNQSGDYRIALESQFS
jgi:hypothetical protein